MKRWKAARCFFGVALVVVSTVLIVVAMLAVFLDIQRNSKEDWLIFGSAMFLFCLGLVFLAAFGYAVKKVYSEEKALKLADKKAVENRCKLQTVKEETKLRITKELDDLRTMREPVSLLSNKNVLVSNKNALSSNKPLVTSKGNPNKPSDFDFISNEPPAVLSQNEEEPGFEMVPRHSKKSEIGSKSKKRVADTEEKRSRKENNEAVSPQLTESQASDWNRMPSGEESTNQTTAPK